MADRDNTDSWVRIAFVLLGMVAILRAVEILHPTVEMLFVIGSEDVESTEHLRRLLWWCLGRTVAPIVLIVGGYFLIRHCQNLSARLCNTPGRPAPYWEYAAYRLGFMLCGIMAISWGLPHLAEVFRHLAISSATDPTRNLVWSKLFMVVVQCGIGVYLIIGSPHIIKWQMKRGESVPATPEAGKESTES